MRKVYLRILPFAVLTYFFCYLDRINVGFAALTMNKDIGLDAAGTAWRPARSSGAMSCSRCRATSFSKRSARGIWIARIMITWGIISGCTAFATGPYSFMAIRFLLGLAEAGLFPGFVLYFTYWFPDQHRARINSGFTLALPIAVASGAPVSTALLGLDGLVGPQGMAGHVHLGGHPDGPDRDRRVLLPDRPAERGALAQSRGTGLAERQDDRTSGGRSRRTTGPDCCAPSTIRR